jgi:hypothetical protein
VWLWAVLWLVSKVLVEKLFPNNVHTVSFKLYMDLLYKLCFECKMHTTLISGFQRDVDETWVLLRYYAASCGNCLPTFWNNVSAQSSRVKSLELFTSVSGQRIGPIFKGQEFGIVYQSFGTTYRSSLQGSRVWNCLPAFRDNVSVQSSRVKSLELFTRGSGQRIGPIFKGQESELDSWPLKMRPISCHETLVNNYHTTPRNMPEERRSY